MVGVVENDSAARRAAYEYEYHRRPEVMEKKRQYQIDASHSRKLETTKKRFIEHSIDELLKLARKRCVETGVDYEANKAVLEAALRILHGQ